MSFKGLARSIGNLGDRVVGSRRDPDRTPVGDPLAMHALGLLLEIEKAGEDRPYFVDVTPDGKILFLWIRDNRPSWQWVIESCEDGKIQVTKIDSWAWGQI